MTELVTDRLILRSLQPSDAPALADATAESWDALSRWMRWATDREKFTSFDNGRAYIQQCQDMFQLGKDLTFGGFDKNTGDFILLSRLAPVPDQPEAYEFCGYWCRTAQQGNGYMSEAVQALIGFACETLQAQRLKITHASGNGATRAVIDKMGFVETDIFKNAHALPDGRMVDEHVLWLEKP